MNDKFWSEIPVELLSEIAAESALPKDKALGDIDILAWLVRCEVGRWAAARASIDTYQRRDL